MRSLSVMIVDDDSAARDLLSSILRTQFNATIESVSDSIVAMRKFREQAYDIVCMDFEMPGMDGLAAIEVIKSVRPDQFVVMVSAHNDIDIVKRAIALGVGGYLVKPFTSGKIKGVIDKYMQSRSG